NLIYFEKSSASLRRPLQGPTVDRYMQLPRQPDGFGLIPHGVNILTRLTAFFLSSSALLFAGTGEVPIFDGKTFNGWSGDTNSTWRIENGTFTGGSLTKTVPRNEFLCTQRPYTNFVLRLKFKLTGKSGFINGGVQFRSQRATDPPNEMIGYQ